LLAGAVEVAANFASGRFLFSFFGHGAEEFWTQEQIVMLDEHAGRFVADAVAAYVAGRDPDLSLPAEVDRAALDRVVSRNRAEAFFGHLFARFDAEPGQEWIASYKRGLLHGLKHMETGVQICKALENAGVAALPMRGPFFGATLYGDVGTRYFTDLDVLVPREMTDRAWNVVSALGYRLANPILTRAMYLRHHLAWPLHNEEDVCLDLHWALDHPYTSYAVAYDALFASTHVDGHLEGAWRVPDPGHLVLINCLHFAKEWGATDSTRLGLLEAILQGKLMLCLDIALAVKAAGPLLDWPEICLLARKWNIIRPLAMGAAILRDLSMDIPEDLPSRADLVLPRREPRWLRALVKSRFMQHACGACAFRPERILDMYGGLKRPRGGWIHLGAKTTMAALDGIRCLWRLHRRRRSA